MKCRRRLIQEEELNSAKCEEFGSTKKGKSTKLVGQLEIKSREVRISRAVVVSI